MFADSYSFLTLFITAILAFVGGLLLKTTLVRKQRKRILNLEDEMLSNHSRILALEKKIAESRKDKNGVSHEFDTPVIKTDVKLS